MTRISLIIPICICVVSGCAIFDRTGVETDKQAVSAPVMDKDTASEQTLVKAQQPVTVLPPAPSPAPRKLNREAIRRLQIRLREIGFDPGPVDGVAGPKTKHALERLQRGCANVAPAVEGFSPAGAVHDLPGRPETLALQTQLRAAGFDPGPADGIFGNRTKAALGQLQTGCLMAKEIDGSLDEGLRTVRTPPAVAVQKEVANASVKSQSSETRQTSVVPATSESQEEIRILQLRLRDAGFDPGPFDGVMGPKTRLALQAYEASQSGKRIKTSLQTKAISGQY